MDNIIIEAIGYAAAVVGTSLMLPQVIKSFRTRKVEDISFVMLIFYFFNCLLWGIYGVLIKAKPVIICNIMAITISIIQIILKIKYSKKKQNN